MWQPAALLFPDVELLLTGALRDALATRSEFYAQEVLVSNAVPDIRERRMVIVRNDGGPLLGDVRALTRVGFNVYGPTPQQAQDLARLIGALVGGLAGSGDITAVPSVGVPSEVADPSGQDRYYLTAEIHVRGTAT